MRRGIGRKRVRGKRGGKEDCEREEIEHEERETHIGVKWKK